MKLSRLILMSCLTFVACTPSLEQTEGSVTDSTDLGRKRISPDVAKRLSLDLLAKRAALGDTSAGELQTVRGVHIDERGEAHTRVSQTFNGVPVFGAQVIVHLKADGALKGYTEAALRGIAVDTKPTLTSQQAVELAVQGVGGWNLMSEAPKVDLQILKAGRSGPQLTWRVQLFNTHSDEPSMPVVFINAHKGGVAWSYNNLQTAKNREVHNLNHGTSLPGAVARTEGQATVGETDVDTNYTRLGSTYDCYSALFGRDSFDNAGAKLISSVHYSNNYVNAYWNGTQMVYGDGDNVNSKSLAISMDVTAHELTHAVTSATSDLIYDGESGGLNEAMSDIFGNVCEWHRDNSGDVNGPTSANNWMVGEDIWLADPALRYMDDPSKDGASLDYYTSTSGNVDVHYSSGIANLAFYLLAHGGTHPKGKSTTVVTGVGIHAAARIFYRINTVYLTPSSSFADAREASVKAAGDLFGPTSAEAVQAANAWLAVGVAAPPNYKIIDTKTDLSAALNANLQFNFPTNGATAMKFVTSGGTGDVDLYVKFGSAPTLTSYDCRPYVDGNAETCEFNPAKSGTYYLMLQGYAAYSGVKLTTYAADGADTEICTDGIDNDDDGKVDCDDTDCNADPACTVVGETSCTDGIDNDADGKVDCDDSECAADPACAPASEASCNDGIDNDNDGKIDCDDSDCSASPFCGPATEMSCVDGIDNDADGKIDCEDSDCATDPACVTPTTETSCTDGIDNDADGQIDCADTDCNAAPVCTPVWVEISKHGFETGWLPYKDGGNDTTRVYNPNYAATGSFSLQIRDNSGDASSFSTSMNMNLSAYSKMKIDYAFYAVGMEAGEDFFVEVLDGSSWKQVSAQVSGSSFSNNTHLTDSITVDLSTIANKAAVKIRFHCDASDNSDQVYIDDITVSAN